MPKIVKPFFITLLFTGCGGNLFADVITPVKSSVDPKSYRALVLANGMQVMLVSDSRADQAAAALDVHVGSGSDPAEWNGLAHFLEHMLFLGTAKYPQAGEYQKFIQSRGGSNNAYTSYAHTNYFFSVNHDSLAPALDRFSRFFIDPTFEQTFVNRERSVVHSEYQARLKNEGRRIWSAQKQILNPQHPASRFSVGSEQTLRDRDAATARDTLIAFYKRWYSANIMALSVVGRESLDELEAMVRQRFSAVPNHQIKPAQYTQPYLNQALRPIQINIVPEKELNSVSFTFPIPSLVDEYRRKPANYLSNLIGDEGQGSLLATLKQKGWADSLSAGVGFMDRQQGTIVIAIGLTEPGVDRIAEIGEMLFYSINLLATQGVQRWRFDEDAQLGKIAFEFAEEAAAGGLARSLAARMHDYPLADVLRGPYVMQRFAPARIKQILAMMQPDNLYLQVVSPRHKVHKRTPWYQVQYGITAINQAWMTQWRNAGNARFTDIALPPANPFIPQRLALLSMHSAMQQPARIANTGDVDAWYRADQTFQTPRSRFYFSVKTPFANDSASSAVHTGILVRMLNQQLNPITYPARLANLNYSLYKHSRGMAVRLSGYQDKQAQLLDVVLEALNNPEIDPQKLELTKAELIRSLKNNAKKAPSSQTIQQLYKLLLFPYWTEPEQLAAVATVTPASLRAHIKKLMGPVSLTALAHGDIALQDATAMVAKVANSFAGAKKLDHVEPARLRRLKDDSTYLSTMDIAHSDSAIVVYLQGNEKTLAARARANLLGQLLEAPFYFELRTTRRVGYLVFAGAFNIGEVPGIMMSVQSPSHTVNQINQLIDGFIDAFPATLMAMREPEFAQIRSAMVAQILNRDTRLSSTTNRYWQEIDLEIYSFDSRQRLADAISRLTKADIQQFLTAITTVKRRQLTVQSAGRRDGASADSLAATHYIETGAAESFRASATSYFPAR